MIFLTLLNEFISEHRSLVMSYLISASLFFIMVTIVVPLTVGSIGAVDMKNDSVVPAVAKISSVAALMMGLFILKTYTSHQLIPTLVSYIKKKLFRIYLQKHEIHFKDADVSSHITQLLEVVETIKTLFIWCIDTVLPVLFLSVCVNLVIGYYVPVLGVLYTCVNLVLYQYVYYAGNKILDVLSEQQKQFMKLISTVGEKFSNLMNIYLHNKINDSVAEYEEIDNLYTEQYKENNKSIQSYIFTVRSTAYSFALISVLYMYYLVSKNQLPVSTFITVSAIIFFYCNNMDLVFDRTVITTKEISSILLNEALFTMPVSNTVEEQHVITNGEINIQNLSFRYNENYLFKNMSLHVSPNEKIVIVGQTGCGKSTLIKILLGFYPIQEGSIQIDGHDLQTIHIHKIRSSIHYINQQTILFNDTLLENMKYGTDSSDDDIISLLQRYELLTVFGDSVQSLDRIVEKQGTNISAGMQKVILVVRGILRPCKVLIMDEPFTSVDTNTRSKILQLITHETTNKTVMIITHDMNGLETIMNRCVTMKELQKEGL
jgi:ABC-type multidrug transport system fused ATPase/permease subunit